MDWQQAVSLGIVVLAMSAFVWRGLRRRRHPMERDNPCGCAGHAPGEQPGIVYRRQRGGPQEIVIRSK